VGMRKSILQHRLAERPNKIIPFIALVSVQLLS
jgi:hypothetical protein